MDAAFDWKLNNFKIQESKAVSFQHFQLFDNENNSISLKYLPKLFNFHSQISLTTKLFFH
jgi:hypothetical protein